MVLYLTIILIYLIISMLCRASFMQLRHLRSIRDALIHDSLGKVTHAFISSRLDYCNALLYDLRQSSISKLQCIKNVAARLLMGTTKFYHITPVLKSCAFYDQAPECMRDMLQERTNVRTFRSILSSS